LGGHHLQQTQQRQHNQGRRRQTQRLNLNPVFGPADDRHPILGATAAASKQIVKLVSPRVQS